MLSKYALCFAASFLPVRPRPPPSPSSQASLFLLLCLPLPALVAAECRDALNARFFGCSLHVFFSVEPFPDRGLRSKRFPLPHPLFVCLRSRKPSPRHWGRRPWFQIHPRKPPIGIPASSSASSCVREKRERLYIRKHATKLYLHADKHARRFPTPPGSRRACCDGRGRESRGRSRRSSRSASCGSEGLRVA